MRNIRIVIIFLPLFSDAMYGVIKLIQFYAVILITQLWHVAFYFG